SLVEQVLQRDPSGIYPRMDFLSRDRQRRAVEELAPVGGEEQVRVALRAVESARQAAAKGALTDPSTSSGSSRAGSRDDREAHVGYHLVGRGRRELEADLAYRPRLKKRLRRLVFAHATFAYLAPIAAIAGLLVAAATLY